MPSWASSTGGIPEAGSAWATLPPTVPRLRTAGCAIRAAHSTSAGSAAASSASSSTAAMRRNAPIRTTSASMATWSSPATPAMSTRTSALVVRAQSSATSDWPPASTRARPGAAASAATVSSTVVVRW